VAHDPVTVPASSASGRRIEVIAAGYSSDPTQLKVLTEALGDPDEYVRASALGALARREELTGTQVIEALKDPAATTRQRAAMLSPQAGGRQSRRQLDEALRGMVDDPVPLCVVCALVAIGARGDRAAVPQIIALAASHRDPLVIEESVATLAALGDPAGLPSVLAATEGKPALRRRAVAALGAFDGDEVEAALDRLADDRDWQVRQAVAMLRRGDEDA